MEMLQAISFWRRTLGEDFVRLHVRGEKAGTFASAAQNAVTLLPKNAEELQECLLIARQHRVPIRCISSGKNWGYGSALPVRNQTALIDLSRMNRILDFDDKLGTVTLQPGVTQQQLYDFIQERQAPFCIDATGSSPHCSIIGNTMERGFGHTPYGDHFSHVANMTVMLTDGRVIHTGMKRFPDARAASTYRWGAGPSIDGLFSQSNLGIVTEMTLWLMPKPDYFQAFFMKVDQEDGLPGLVEALRPLRMDSTIRSAVHIGNHYKALSAMQQYPWEMANHQRPLPVETRMQLQKEYGIGAWSGCGALYGTRAQVKASRQRVANALKGKVDGLQFMDDARLNLLKHLPSWSGSLLGLNIQKLLGVVEPVYGLMKGIPTETQLASAYWRKKMAVPAHPDLDRDRCGLIWCAPIAPMTGADAQRMAEIATEVLGPNFEPILSLTLLNERSVSCIISICYDRDTTGEDTLALATYHALCRRLKREGYYFYRQATIGMQHLDASDDYRSVMRDIKHTLDPDMILDPGRYIAQESANYHADRKSSSA